MQHKISDLCDKVSVMYEKSMNLRRMKYDTPKADRQEHMIKELIFDIQALSGEIYYDRATHPKLEKEK